jgi:hypothetical protein
MRGALRLPIYGLAIALVAVRRTYLAVAHPKSIACHSSLRPPAQCVTEMKPQARAAWLQLQSLCAFDGSKIEEKVKSARALPSKLIAFCPYVEIQHFVAARAHF